ncbi:MAG: DegV family protein [Acholeplasmatales bacterium]|nr:DegV family protein [Acholeplasmatales bacterium]
MVKIISDSTCDLSQELIKENDIEIIPLLVTFNEDTFQDGVDIDAKKIYEEVAKRNILPKTSAVSAMVLEEAFRKWVDQGYEVVYTGISSKMSSTYNNAVLAANEIGDDKVFVVDSKNLSTGIGLTVLKACRDRDKGLSAKEIVENMKYNIDRVKAQFAIERMDYLHKGGRCSGIARFAATLLRIKPIIFVRDGSMTVGKKPLGKIKVALDVMLKMLEEDKNNNNVDPEFIFVTDAIAPESREYLIPKVKEMFPNTNVYSTIAGGVIASHCGPGTIGILYICKNEVHL